MVLIILSVFPRFEQWIDRVSEARTYRVVCTIRPKLLEELQSVVADCGLRAEQGRRSKVGGEMVCTWNVYGAQQGHDELVEKLLAHAEVKEFQV